MMITMHMANLSTTANGGNTMFSVNVVALRRGQLVPGWVTVCGQVNHFSVQPATQVNWAWPSLTG